MTELEKKAAESEQLLLHQVAYPAFAEKLAQLGVVWQNDQEFGMLDALGVRLYEEAQQTQREASSPLTKRAFEYALGPQVAHAAAHEHALAGVRQEPAIKEAALAYHDYFAAQTTAAA